MQKECTETTCSGPGEFKEQYGSCVCNYNPIECDLQCEASRPKFTVRRNDLGILELVTSNGSYSTIQAVTGELGVSDFDRTDHSSEIISYGTDGIRGFIPRDFNQASEIVSSTPVTAPTQAPTASARRRRRAVTVPSNDTSVGNNASQVVQNPTFCFQIAQSLVFKIQINEQNRTLSHYPRYRKNHLFNTNPSFDYGNFRQLHSIITETNKTLYMFVHVFEEAGTFVFYDNAVPSRETVVSVMKLGEKCPFNRTMESTNEKTYDLLGVKKAEVGISEIFRITWKLLIPICLRMISV